MKATNGASSFTNQYKIYKDKRLNETERQNSLVRTYKALSKLKCISDCTMNDQCKLITFNKSDNICKYYRYYLNDAIDESTLIESNGDFVYYHQMSISSIYNLQGVVDLTLSTVNCQVTSIIKLPSQNLAIGCLDTKGSIQIWSTTSWSSILSFTHGNRVNSFSIFQNKHLLSAGEDNQIKLWAYTTGQLLKTFSGHNGNVRLVIALNNDDIASGSDDKTIKIWNPIDTNERFTFSEASNIAGLVQIEMGSLISISLGGSIKLWDPFEGILLKSFSLQFSPTAMIQHNTDCLILGDNKGVIFIFDINTTMLKNTLSGHNNEIIGLFKLKNNDLASYSFDNTIIIWDWNSMSVKYTLKGHSDTVSGLVVLPNGYLVSAGKDSKLIVWK